MKTCTKCQQIKNLDQFGKGRAECKSCANERLKSWRGKNKAEPTAGEASFDRLSAKVNEILSGLDHKAPLAELVPLFLSKASLELIPLLTAAPAAPAPAP